MTIPKFTANNQQGKNGRQKEKTNHEGHFNKAMIDVRKSSGYTDQYNNGKIDAHRGNNNRIELEFKSG